MPDNKLAAIDYEDLSRLPELVDVIREAAGIHGEYLNNPDAHQALMAVAKNIEDAQKRFWTPDAALQDAYEHRFDVSEEPANEAVYQQHEVA
tara:strand:- start:3658 stop:3933 length:276 start_codon:yes stop_codon:yes gene_type:complete